MCAATDVVEVNVQGGVHVQVHVEVNVHVEGRWLRGSDRVAAAAAAPAAAAAALARAALVVHLVLAALLGGDGGHRPRILAGRALEELEEQDGVLDEVAATRELGRAAALAGRLELAL